MPLIGSSLGQLMQTEVNNRIQGLAGTGPLSQLKPSYFKQMMSAIGNGTVLETTGKLQFTSSNPAPPSPTGPNSDTGLIFDDSFFKEQLYRKLRAAGTTISGRTLHDPYPPSSKNSGEYLLAICEGLGSAIRQHYAKSALLTSPQTSPSPGKIEKGNFSGIVPSSIVGAIIGFAPSLAGQFFPQFALIYASVYTVTIHTRTSSKTASPWYPSGTVT